MRYYFTTIALLAFLFSFNSALAQSEEYGVASYYADSFQGSKTASGEAYDKGKYTGAHKKLPFGTVVKVTRLDTKQSVKIRINDRGPYIKGRIVELSRKAAEQINLVDAGVAKVKIEVLGSGTVPDEFANIENPTTSIVREIPSSPVPSRTSDKLTTKVKQVKKPAAKKQTAPATTTKATTKQAAPKKQTAPKPKDIAPLRTATRVRGGNFKLHDLYKVQVLRPERSGYGVQVASLTNYANVMMQVAELQEKWFDNILISVEKGKGNDPVYKVLLGPFPDRKTAKSYEKDLKRKKKIDGFIVELESIKY